MAIETLAWQGGPDGHLRLIDQTRLPDRLEYLECTKPEDVWQAIRRLSVRGAPAIGVAAAWGAYLGIQGFDGDDRTAFDAELAKTCDYLHGSRPTAVNLDWALREMRRVAGASPDASPSEALQLLFETAQRIQEEDRKICRRLGRVGSALVRDGGTLLTHCNAGGLATSDYGTALAVCYAAKEEGKKIRVVADETRPLLQGARLTAWELQREGIDVTVICDSMAGTVLRDGIPLGDPRGIHRVDAVFVGADRIAGNGDVANKIGTYPLAVLAHEHGVPFYVVAPRSTFDLSLESGDEIPIEERDAGEITEGFGERTAPEGIGVYNPAFDVTPARLITGIATEHGLIQPVDREQIRRVLAAGAT